MGWAASGQTYPWCTERPTSRSSAGCAAPALEALLILGGAPGPYLSLPGTHRLLQGQQRSPRSS